MSRAPLIAVTGRRRSAAGLHLGGPALDALEIEGFFTGYADHLVAAGALPDGVVEGLELPGMRLLGVQWHPEQLHGPQPVFGWLVDAAR